MRRVAAVAVGLLLSVAAAGCGGGSGPGGEDTAFQADQAPGAPGASGPGGPDEDARAPGSPITLPPFQQIGGQPVDTVRPQIDAAIREACTPRHDLCVTTVVKARGGAGLHACFGGTDPPTKDGAELERGTVLTVWSEPGGCGLPDPGEESSSSTESSETIQAPPSSDTGSSGGQPPSSS